MKAFIILTVAISAAVARPEAPLPSSYYPSPSDSSGGGYPAPVYGSPQQQPVIHKHVYVHVPPPEAPEYKAPKYVPAPPPPQKHYKIVFIKAPTPPTPTAPALPPLPQPDEEKTLIYVLVKKPEEQPDIVIPTQAPTQPSKPEVYFIRYKTQKEQQGAYGPPSVTPGTPIDNYGPPSHNDGPY
ncbi:extensin-1 [Copidosoma floridanum]|uniref:extensin-1 n=1 Tax=Copidosoma floridanum TaxID=29053 RepID=UPI0006C9A0B4|nr:extensin-1 [Copidosoma floridanum]